MWKESGRPGNHHGRCHGHIIGHQNHQVPAKCNQQRKVRHRVPLRPNLHLSPTSGKTVLWSETDDLIALFICKRPLRTPEVRTYQAESTPIGKLQLSAATPIRMEDRSVRSGSGHAHSYSRAEKSYPFEAPLSISGLDRREGTIRLSPLQPAKDMTIGT